MVRTIKILHITNHSGTILNATQVAKYINNDSNYNLNISITNKSWNYSYYINESQANEIFQVYKDEITPYDILLFSDTAMYGRPFLQNIENHPCQIIFYITNRFDWGIWNISDDSFYKLYSTLSRNNRVIFISDNRYDKYYAQERGIYFPLEDYLRLVPFVSSTLIIPDINTSSNNNKFKFLIQNRGTDIKFYSDILNNYNIQYDIFDSNNRYRDKEHICEYLGILHLPYQVNIQSLWENLGYGIIHFIPSKRFIMELLKNTEWYYWEERNREEKSIEFSEWYASDLENCFIYFDNWQDLYCKYNSIISLKNESGNEVYPKWYIEKKQTILEKVKENNKSTLSKWVNIFMRLFEQKPTIVSMFYNIRSMDGDLSDYHRKKETFYSLAKKFILSLNMPLFLCMDADDIELINMIRETRKEKGLENITYLYFEKFENTYFYKYIDRIKEMQSKYIIHNGNLRHETPRYITLNNNKFHFIEKAIEINPFCSNKFLWLDMGINHVAQKPFEILNWQYQIPEKIKQICINPYLENILPKEIFHNIYHHTAGGLFSGSKEYLSMYIKLYKNKIEQILNEEWYQIDEAIMTIIQRENRDMFEFYYGDYDGIIANYNKADLSMNLIMTSIEKTIKFNKLNETLKILKYLIPYFLIEANQYSGHFYQFIHYNILADHIENNILLDIVIELINKKIIINDARIKSLLTQLENELKIYKNKDKIIL